MPDPIARDAAPERPSEATLASLIDEGAPIERIAALLDALDDDGRWGQVEGLSRARQARLFELAGASEPVTADDFVPEGTPGLTPIIHRGWNSLPLPAAWRRFAKPMCRGADGRIFGFNDAGSRWLVGPGYFVLHGTSAEEGNPGHWFERGGQVVDYYQVPNGEIPKGWPRVWPNWFGLQVLIYFQTRDFMRRVSRHVTIGAAYKWDRPLQNFFVLVRKDR